MLCTRSFPQCTLLYSPLSPSHTHTHTPTPSSLMYQVLLGALSCTLLSHHYTHPHTYTPSSLMYQVLRAPPPSCVWSWQLWRRKLIDFPIIRICSGTNIARKSLTGHWLGHTNYKLKSYTSYETWSIQLQFPHRPSAPVPWRQRKGAWSDGGSTWTSTASPASRTRHMQWRTRRTCQSSPHQISRNWASCWSAGKPGTQSQ